MDEAVREYIDAIPPEHRGLFDRFHRLILAAYPDAAVVLSCEEGYSAGRIEVQSDYGNGAVADGRRASLLQLTD